MTIDVAGVPEAVRRLAMDVYAGRVWTLTGRELVERDAGECRQYHHATARSVMRRELVRMLPTVIGHDGWREVRLTEAGEELVDAIIAADQLAEALAASRLTR